MEEIKKMWVMEPFKDETITISLPKRPNWWIRFWMRLFFGWRFVWKN